MLAGGLMMIAAGTVRGEWTELSFSTRTVTALAYLSTIGAVGGFVAYTYALRHLAVSFVSLYAYINPMIAVALGVVVLGEPFNSRVAIAAALVFAGVAIVRSRASASPADDPNKPETRQKSRTRRRAGSRRQATAAAYRLTAKRVGRSPTAPGTARWRSRAECK